MVYSPDGSTVLQEIEKDKSGKSVFEGGIYQVKQKGNGDYVVSGNTRIVCVGRDGEYKWGYHLGSICFGVVWDRYNNVIVAQYLDDKVLLLSNDGKLIKTLLTKKDVINRPYSLSVGKHDCLWIGQDQNVKVVKYLK